MCDWCSWIEKNGKNYYLTDDMIEAKWPGCSYQDKIGHAAIEDYYKIKGTHKESGIKIPLKIAREVNRGNCVKMMEAGGWSGMRYKKTGEINWPDVERFLNLIKAINWFDNHGEIKRNWKMFATRDAAREAAWDAARAAWAATRDAAWAAARDAARAAAWDAARDAARAAEAAAWAAAGAAAGAARCIFALGYNNPHTLYMLRRMEVWVNGFGLWCDIDGTFYCYRKP